jgi:hypothetical protein
MPPSGGIPLQNRSCWSRKCPRVPRCNTPGVYIPLDNEYEFKHVILVGKTDAKF